MKNKINKLKDWVIFWIWVLLVFWVANAWVNLWTVNTWDSLTSTIWNDLITKVNDIWARTDWIYNNWWSIWIWTPSPSSKLDVAGNINVSWQALSKTFYVRSSDANVKCINVNYAPTWYSDDDCIWLFSWYAFYEFKSQDDFTTYTDSSCTTVYETRWLNNVKYDDRHNTNHYMKIPVMTWFHSELFCQKWMVQGIISY